MTIQKLAIGLVAVALLVGGVAAHAADISVGSKAYQRGAHATASSGHLFPFEGYRRQQRTA